MLIFLNTCKVRKTTLEKKHLGWGECKEQQLSLSSLQRCDFWWFNLARLGFYVKYTVCATHTLRIYKKLYLCVLRGRVECKPEDLMGKQTQNRASRRKINQQSHPTKKTYSTFFLYGNCTERGGCSPFSFSCLYHLHSGLTGLPVFIYSFGFLPHRQ